MIAAESAWVCVLAEDLPGDAAGQPAGGGRGRELVMEVLFERVAGLDVGKESVVVCVRTPAAQAGRRRSETRTFSTMSRSLGLMRKWCVEQGVTIAAIESTSTYWKPPFYALEEVMDVWLLNAGHMKAVPGRKTDVRDAEWIAQLLEHGCCGPRSCHHRTSAGCGC